MFSQVEDKTSSLHKPQNMSRLHYTISPHILKKLNTSSPVLSLFKSYYAHSPSTKKFPYTWLERAVQAFTLKMVQVQSEYHIESHDIFIGATAISAKRVINPKFDDVLLTGFGEETKSFLWHMKDVSKCPSIVSRIQSILKTPFKILSDKLDFL